MTTDDFDELTCRIPFETNKQLVFGAPRPRRVRLPFRLIFVVACLSAIGCVTGRPAAEAPETVGTLSASYHSIAVAPTHAATDLTPSFGAVEGDDTAGEVATTVTRGDVAAVDGAELPDVATKDQGLKTGEAR